MTTSTVARRMLIPGAALFAGSYLAAGPISSALVTGTMPQPSAAPAEAQAWFAANITGSVVLAALQVLSVVGLAMFVAGVGRVTRAGAEVRGARMPRTAVALGIAAVAAMVVSSLIAVSMAVTITALDPGTFGVLRMAGFYAGGTVHVALLGLFALTASRLPGMSKPVRVLAIVVAVIAVASLASIAFYYASLLILVGRLLAMVWTIVTAISLVRRRVGTE